MLFGSEEMKEILKDMMASPALYDKNIPLLYDVVYQYTKKRVKKGFEATNGLAAISMNDLNDADCEDIAEEVMDAVTKSLESFVANIDHYDARSRQAWLKKIVYVKFVRYIQKTQKFKMGKEDETQTVTGTEDEILFKETLSLVVKRSLEAPSKPEKILCFLINVLVFRVLEKKRQNNPSVSTSEYISGKTLFHLHSQFKQYIRSIYGVILDDEITQKMDDMVGKDAPTTVGTRICMATAKTITDWTNRMKGYLYSFKDEIVSGEIR